MEILSRWCFYSKKIKSIFDQYKRRTNIILYKLRKLYVVFLNVDKNETFAVMKVCVDVYVSLFDRIIILWMLYIYGCTYVRCTKTSRSRVRISFIYIVETYMLNTDGSRRNDSIHVFKKWSRKKNVVIGVGEEKENAFNRDSIDW